MIDLAPMKGCRVDAVSRTARAEAGLTLAELDRDCQALGLATPTGIVSPTGIAGLTLGGGIGWLGGKHGLSCDNLESVDIVTADGRLLVATRTEYPDLFWAVRGGGANLGVVTSFEYRLHEVGPVLGGGIAWPLARAKHVLPVLRRVRARLPGRAEPQRRVLHRGRRYEGDRRQRRVDRSAGRRRAAAQAAAVT